ncbi:MAG: hypothetical protein ABI555_07885 [Chloroflexota bacterium]
MIIDLTIREEMLRAIETGLIWSAPQGAIEDAMVRIALGLVPEPANLPAEVADIIRNLRASEDRDPGTLARRLVKLR